mmetsp:Transcript_9455/g.24039  ORF Transcript_9455/g.24039 Transcript_9455/m.24039 type:complete len:117 (+) Transcript_9455:3-353(+)
MWGYCPEEAIMPADLFKVNYQGIRPAPSYPSAPAGIEKFTLFEMVKAGELANMRLTESASMLPASSVSALIFSHPKSEYFAVGSLPKEAVQDYADRRGITLEQGERWLTANLAYDP